MTDKERKLLKELLSERQETALINLRDNTKYLEARERQKESEKLVDELYQRFTREERLIIRRHYEGEMDKQSFELDVVYIQGLRDGFAVLSMLGAFHNGIEL